MRIEVPDFARCCACIPLRYGILTFGYLNLGFTIFLLVLEIWLCVVYEKDYPLSHILQAPTTYMYRGIGLFSQMWFILIIYALEIIFNVVLLVGAHMKKPRLIRAYYYFGITTTLAVFVSYVTLSSEPNRTWFSIEHTILECCLAFSGLVLQVYLLLLIRSELKKLDVKTRMCFINHAAEAYMDPLQNEEGRSPL